MLYTVDKELLQPQSEIRIGEKIYKIDDRTSVVKQVLELANQAEEENAQQMEQILRCLLGQQAYEEIEAMDLPFAAYLQIFEMAVGAVVGDNGTDARFCTKTGCII